MSVASRSSRAMEVLRAMLEPRLDARAQEWLALACDDILATESAPFGLPEIRLAAFPPVQADQSSYRCRRPSHPARRALARRAESGNA